MAKDCIQCDEHLRDKAKFCPRCGTAQPQEAPPTMLHAEALSERQATQEEEENGPSISENKAEPLPDPNALGEKAAPSISPVGHKEEAKSVTSDWSEKIYFIMKYLPKEIKRTHALAAMALFAVLALLFFTTSRVDRLIQQGDSYFDEKEYQAALEAYNKAIEIDPESAVAYTRRGKVYYAQDDINRALAAFNHAIDLDPEYAPVYRIRGVLSRKEGQLDSALKDFNRAIDLDPKYAAAYTSRGILYERRDDFEAALADYTAAIKLDPDDSLAYLGRGEIFIEQKKYEAAIAEFTKAIEVDPDESYSYKKRGTAYRLNKNYQAAINDLKQSIEISPQSSSAHYQLGLTYKDTKNYNEAVDSFTTAIKLSEDFSSPHFWRAVTYDKLGREESAVKGYEQFLALDQGDNERTRYACERVNDLDQRGFWTQVFTGDHCKRFQATYTYDEDDPYGSDEYEQSDDEPPIFVDRYYNPATGTYQDTNCSGCTHEASQVD